MISRMLFMRYFFTNKDNNILNGKLLVDDNIFGVYDNLEEKYNIPC